MKEWIISDTHFNHAKIIEYCNRPFSSVEEMNKTLIENWNSAVSKDDIVWHLGDFAMGTKEQVTQIVEQLNGRIYLVLGNHDNHTMKWYYDCGFAKVYDRPVLYRDFFIMSHHPRTANAPIYRYFYGHVHIQDEYRDFTSNSICVCAERFGYTPILIDDALKIMKHAKKLNKQTQDTLRALEILKN